MGRSYDVVVEELELLNLYVNIVSRMCSKKQQWITDTELTRLRGVRSIEKAICLSKLGFFGDMVGMEMIQSIENCEEVRRTTEDRIASEPDSGLTGKWLQTLGHALFHGYSQFFAETGIMIKGSAKFVDN